MNVRLKYDMHFNAGIYFGGRTQLNTYTVRLWMITNTENSEDQSIAFERIKFFVYNQIDNTIFVNRKEQDQCVKFLQAGLNITTMPGDPVDQLIGIMLHHKLNSIMENRMIIVETEISSAYGQNMTYLHSEEENALDIEPTSWWNSAGLEHSDLYLTESDKIVSMQSGTAWRDLDLAWDDVTPTVSTENKVVFADFKPHDSK